jgi:hypothetical protein
MFKLDLSYPLVIEVSREVANLNKKNPPAHVYVANI